MELSIESVYKPPMHFSFPTGPRDSSFKDQIDEITFFHFPFDIVTFILHFQLLIEEAGIEGLLSKVKQSRDQGVSDSQLDGVSVL